MPVDPPASNATYGRNFAAYYDRLNQHKDYVAEVDRLDDFIHAHTASRRPRVLDIGCGTGEHAVLLSRRGHDVCAIDLSSEMIEVAKGKKTDAAFFAGDIAGFERTDFEFGYSLFNVVNCLGSLEDLTRFFSAIARCLRDGAPFLVETWNAIAVIAVPPTVVERVYVAGGEKIVRKVTPTHDLLHQRLDLRYDIDVFSGETARKLRSFSVVHRLVLFTPLEIEACLKSAGFCDIVIYTALPELAPGTTQDRMLAFACRKDCAR